MPELLQCECAVCPGCGAPYDQGMTAAEKVRWARAMGLGHQCLRCRQLWIHGQRTPEALAYVAEWMAEHVLGG